MDNLEQQVRDQFGSDTIDRLSVTYDKNKLIQVMAGGYTAKTGERGEINEIRKAVDREIKIATKKSKIEASSLTLQQIITDYNVCKVQSGGKLYWMYQDLDKDAYGNREWKMVTKDVLRTNFYQLNLHIRGSDGQPDYDAFNEFNRLLVDQDKGFHKITQSYRKPAGLSNGELNVMNKEFAKPSSDKSKDYHWFFDTIYKTLSGGSDKNTKEHLEQILLAKWQHPENVFLPGIFINDDGGTFKDLFVVQHLTPLFGGNVLYNGTVDHLLGKFNSLIAGKAIVHISEVQRDKVNMNRLKSNMGAPVILVEAKYEIPYQADNTGLVFSVGNGTQGSVTLSGENQDRRYSIFSPKIDGYDNLIADMKKFEGKNLTREEADEWIIAVGQNIVSNTEQIGKWLSAKIEQYRDIKHLRPIKNEAYHSLIEEQRASWLSYVETVFSEPNFEYIRHELLIKLLHEFNKGFNPASRTMKHEIERLIRDRKLPIVHQERAYIRQSPTISIQRTVWRKVDINSGPGSVLQENEDMFGKTDSNDRWVWTWKA